MSNGESKQCSQHCAHKRRVAEENKTRIGYLRQPIVYRSRARPQHGGCNDIESIAATADVIIRRIAGLSFTVEAGCARPSQGFKCKAGEFCKPLHPCSRFGEPSRSGLLHEVVKNDGGAHSDNDGGQASDGKGAHLLSPNPLTVRNRQVPFDRQKPCSGRARKGLCFEIHKGSPEQANS